MTPWDAKQELMRRMGAKDLPGTLEMIADHAVYFWSSGAAMFGKPAPRAGNQSIRSNDTLSNPDVCAAAMASFARAAE